MLDKKKGDEMFAVMDYLSHAISKALLAVDVHSEMTENHKVCSRADQCSSFGSKWGYDVYTRSLVSHLTVHVILTCIHVSVISTLEDEWFVF